MDEEDASTFCEDDPGESLLFSTLVSAIGTSFFTHKSLLGFMTRTSFPLMAGVLAFDLVEGKRSPKGILKSLLLFGGTGFAVNLMADTLLYPFLFAAGPPAGLYVALFTFGKLAASFALADRLENWFHSRNLSRRKGKSKQSRTQGLKSRLDALLEDNDCPQP
jgi:hypothetical protein